ncbi:MAG: hypothetical protein JOZ27_03480, partial [Caulobacteraceae bacterium]|nr:hypothetical protein [Caulobacteraceae bacterium]
WPTRVRSQRESEGRPVLTVNKLPTFIRQVVNDARQNKPAITIHPANTGADQATAEVMSSLVRQIEYASDADVAYDTALESAVTGGWGYFRINTRYAHDDTFEQDLVIDAVPNPFSIFADPYSMKADSSDWNMAFVVDTMPKKRFEALYKGADDVNWQETGSYTGLATPWIEGEQIQLAEYWRREKIEREIIGLSTGDVLDTDTYERDKDFWDAQGATVIATRPVPSFKVVQYLMTGAEVLRATDWGGIYIPIIPVYGHVVTIGQERHLRGLVRDAKDPQRIFNYWRTVETELLALAPKAPYVGRKGAFESDIAKWETANSESHAFIEYDGEEQPTRQPFAGVPTGVLQAALNANDDLKAVTGIFDANLGAGGNETSGRAILLRQKEGDTSTFHFIDNLSRAIRHAGRVLIDLIPKVYSTPRVIRVMTGDRITSEVPINQPIQITTPDGQPATHVFDLTQGKYDLTVEAGPSFTTKREEAASQMLDLIRAFPQAAPVLGDLLAENLDWPGADKIAERLKLLLPSVLQPNGGQPQQPPPGAAPAGMDPAHAQAFLQAHQAAQDATSQATAAQTTVAQLRLQVAQLQADRTIEQQKADTGDFNAQTKRLEVNASWIGRK